MANLIILYTGNVCSTPMVEYARTSRKIFVPVREHFDHYLFSRHVGDDAVICESLSRTLENLYSRRSDDYLMLPEIRKYRYAEMIPDTDECPHVLFKWRPFGRDLPESQKIVDVFAKFEVRPAIIIRRSLTEQALKIFLSEKVYDSRHQQFKAASMSEDEYEEYKLTQSRISITVSEEEIKVIRNVASNFMTRTEGIFRNREYFFPTAVEPTIITAEDIFEPDINYRKYNDALSVLFGEGVEIQGTDNPGVRKGGLDISNCSNVNEILNDPKLRQLESKYFALRNKNGYDIFS